MCELRVGWLLGLCVCGLLVAGNFVCVFVGLFVCDFVWLVSGRKLRVCVVCVCVCVCVWLVSGRTLCVCVVCVCVAC